MLVRRLLAVGALTAATGIGLVGVAAADTAPEDDRATRHEGNATTCAEAGLAGAQQFGGTTSGGTQDGITVTVTDATYLSYTADSSVTVYGAVIKGGDAYNVYPAGVTTDLRAPLNGGGQIPQISHWFICYDVNDTGAAAPSATVTGNCTDGFTVVLDNTEGTAEAVFTVSVTGSADSTETVAAGESTTLHVDAAADTSTTVSVSAEGMTTVTKTLDCTSDNGGGGNGGGGGDDTDTGGTGSDNGTTVLGERNVRSTPTTVSPTAGTLPFTGSATGTVLAVGLALTALGGLLLLVGSTSRGRHRMATR
jgi:hypothetical protein